MLFGSRHAVGRIAVAGATAYVALVFVLRVSGKRTLSKMNAFAFVVTVTFASASATVLFDRDLAIADGVFAFAMLAALQFVLAWTTARSRPARRVVSAEPRLLLRRGSLLREAMRAERVNEAEISAAVRAAGLARVEAVEAGPAPGARLRGAPLRPRRNARAGRPQPARSRRRASLRGRRRPGRVERATFERDGSVSVVRRGSEPRVVEVDVREGVRTVRIEVR